METLARPRLPRRDNKSGEPPKQDPYVLIEKHLGIGFETKPAHHKLNIPTRIGKFITRPEFRSAMVKKGNKAAFYDPKRDEVYLWPEKRKGNDMLNQVHEAIHALHQRMDPAYFNSLNTSRNIAEVLIDEAIGGELGLEDGDGMRLTGEEIIESAESFIEGAEVGRTFTEGLAEWGEMEIFERERGVTDPREISEGHARMIFARRDQAQKDESVIPYAEGHRFVAQAMNTFARLGLPVSDAIKLLISDPPRVRQHLENGHKYADKIWASAYPELEEQRWQEMLEQVREADNENKDK